MNLFKQVFLNTIGTSYKDFLLALIFIIANILFCCSIITDFIILILAGEISSLTSADFLDAGVNILSITLLLWVGYVCLKIFLFETIYTLTKDINNSSGLFKFLSKFINDTKFRNKTLLITLCLDIVMLVIPYIYLNRYSIWFFIFMSFINCGGVTISYIAFALLGHKKEI